MCHAEGSSPPDAPGAGVVASRTELTLTSADGNRFGAHVARASAPTGAGIVVMPDVRGLHDFYRDLAARFAAIGVDAVAIDYFGRTAGLGDRAEDFDWMTHIQQTTPEGVAADVAAAAAYLRDETGVTSQFTVGFCFGGGYSWRQSADLPTLAGAIGFYGSATRVGDAAERMRAPLLMLVAGADTFIPMADHEKLAADARASGVEVDWAVFDGAPHSFFDRSFVEHAAACDEAWRRVRAFITTHSSRRS